MWWFPQRNVTIGSEVGGGVGAVDVILEERK
jgi:hypothetical protein